MSHKNLFFRIVILFLLSSSVSGGIFAQSRPQDKKVTLDMQQVTAAQLFKTVQQQTGLDFIYNVKDLNLVARFDVHATGESVASLLQRVFKNENFTFEYSENTIIVKPIPDRFSVRGQVVDSATGEPLPGANIRL